MEGKGGDVYEVSGVMRGGDGNADLHITLEPVGDVRTRGMSRGALLIAAERERQKPQHDAESDDLLTEGELIEEAQRLLMAALFGVDGVDLDDWGLIDKFGHDRMRLLVIAGALVAAEIDRVLRMQQASDTVPVAVAPTGVVMTAADMEQHVYGYVYGRNAGAVSDARVQAILEELRVLRGEAHL